MEVVIDKLEWFFAGFVAFVSWYFGGADGFLYALIALTVTDYATGMIAAWMNCRLSSSVGFKGIGKKVGIFAIVDVTHVLDAQLLGHGEVLRDMTIFYYLANEGISILENAVEMGIPVPDFLKESYCRFGTKRPRKKIPCWNLRQNLHKTGCDRPLRGPLFLSLVAASFFLRIFE